MGPTTDGGQGRDRKTPERAVQLLTHHLRLGERVFVQTVVGIGVGAVIVGGALFARFLVGVHELDVVALVLIGLFICAYNGVAWYSARQYRDPERSGKEQVRLLRLMYGKIILDYLVLAVAIWFVGGTRSPFLPFFLLHVIVSCLLLSRRAAVTFHWMAYALLALFVVGEWSRILPAPRLPSGAVGGVGLLDGRYALTVLVVYGLLFGLTAFLLLGMTRTLRQTERQLRAANQGLQRLSAMQRDFLRIALHNLKSPIGVVTLFLNNMKAGLGGPMSPQQDQWVGRSLERLGAVGDFMRDIQMLATLESAELRDRAAPLDLRVLLADLVADQQDLAGQHGTELTAELPEDLPPVRAVELLVREAVLNYVTNGLKYTPRGGHVVLRARHVPPMVRIEVQDDGIGIAREDQARLFGEFVRIRRKDAPTGKQPGSGLGLTIVRRVAEVHGGRAFVESSLHEGSTFVLEFPAEEGAPSAPAPESPPAPSEGTAQES